MAHVVFVEVMGQVLFIYGKAGAVLDVDVLVPQLVVKGPIVLAGDEAGE